MCIAVDFIMTSLFPLFQTWDLLRLMVYGFLDFCTWFITAYPDYFVSPLRINGSAIESIFSVLKFTAGGNLSASNYGSFRGRVITGREVITNSNSERGYLMMSSWCLVHSLQARKDPGHHTLCDSFMVLLD